MKKRVIICGYPKSGNTWLTRLTAQIIGCPVVGFWCEPFNPEQAVEGLDRVSDYQCFKAHHNAEEMGQTLRLYGNGTEKVIYVYRDPRDVLVSSYFHYRNLPVRSDTLYRLFNALPFARGGSAYRRIFHTRGYRLDVLIDALLRGQRSLPWLKTPWMEHVNGFRNLRVLMLRYEDLQTSPLLQAQRIGRHVDVSRSDAELKSAIECQSFAKKRAELVSRGDAVRAAFLREGAVGGWRRHLEDRHIRAIHSAIGPFMEEVGYSPAS